MIPGAQRSDAQQNVRIRLAQVGGLGVLTGVSAATLARSRGWARWSEVGAGLRPALITLGGTVISGGVISGGVASALLTLVRGSGRTTQAQRRLTLPTAQY